jgi:uncharacterized protein YndB with AHSA1/START domain
MTKDPRRIETEIEVPGTPEQVWEAIATGPGLTAWFVPAEVAEGEGGTISLHHAPGMDQTAAITGWDPPRRLALRDEAWQPNPDARAEPLATEFLVEARAGGTCVVRVVMSGFGTGADWDRAIESFTDGWRSALFSLKLYLTRFPGQGSATIVLAGRAHGPQERAWADLRSALGLRELAEGRRAATSAPGAPPFAGEVVRLSAGQAMLVLEEPAPGLGLIAAGGPGEQVFTFIRAHLFGDEAAAVAAREGQAWEAWLAEHFPLPEQAAAG